jgi:cysteine desulfurase/selenocysteine lyase
MSAQAMPGAERRASAYDVDAVRADFPALHQHVHGRPLAYLDNAATTQKPKSVLDAILHFYQEDCSNVHRGVHLLSERATREYEASRERVRRFVGAASEREIVYVRGTTEAINLVARSHAQPRLGPGDEIVITGLEHHSNIVPWQMVRDATGCDLKVAPLDDRGDVALDEYERLLTPRTKMVAFAHVSNALGTVNPVREMVAMAKARGSSVLVDGAQAVPHVPVDVASLGCDFYAFSGHKLYGPMGVGVLWGRESVLDEMPPWQGGGDMISTVSFEKSTWNRVPFKFEAGTPNVPGAIGLAAAMDYVEAIGLPAIAAHEADLLAHASEELATVPGARIVGTAREKASVLSFVLQGIHPHDVGTIVDRQGVAIRTGHHCAEPVMKRYGVPATARASFGLYNTHAEVDAFIASLREVVRLFAPRS